MIKEKIRKTSEGADDANFPFLDLVVCPAYDGAYKSEMLQKYGLDHETYWQEGRFNPSVKNNLEFDLREVVSYNISSL